MQQRSLAEAIINHSFASENSPYSVPIAKILLMFSFIIQIFDFLILVRILLRILLGIKRDARRDFFREILHKNIAIIAIQQSKIYLVDIFGDFSHTVEWNALKSVCQISLYILAWTPRVEGSDYHIVW